MQPPIFSDGIEMEQFMQYTIERRGRSACDGRDPDEKREAFVSGANRHGDAVFKDLKAAWAALKEDDGEGLIQRGYALAPLSQRNDGEYETHG